ncbi:hypothetical protein [Chitinophaga caseinilytica]|uniref:hypothetical protein n=1 Tax=Chitinophaga caseinilytica TaxID=2267521 RepID=UPI003C306D27
MEKTTATWWHPEDKLIHTRISGQVDAADVSTWASSLRQVLENVEDGGSFKIFVDLHGFKAVDFDTHKKFRDIVPLTLAAYGWRVGYLDLFEEANGLPLYNTRGIRCFAAAHAHQDETKIALYEERYSRPQEHFFTDPGAAAKWIRSVHE